MHFWIDKGAYQAIKPYRAFENENIMRSQHHQIRSSQLQANRSARNNIRAATDSQTGNQPHNIEDIEAGTTIQELVLTRRQPHIRCEVLAIFTVFACTVRFFILGSRIEVLIYCISIFILFLILLIFFGCCSQQRTADSTRNRTPARNRRLNRATSPNYNELVIQQSPHHEIFTVIAETPSDSDVHIDMHLMDENRLRRSLSTETAPPSYDDAIQLPVQPELLENNVDAILQSPPPSYADATGKDQISDL